MFTLSQIKKDARLNAFIDQTDLYLKALGYTNHGRLHVSLVSERAKKIAQSVRLTPREQEFAAIAAWCHDMGNFMGRTLHHYWGAVLFGQCFLNTDNSPAETATIMRAIASHDKDELKLVDKLTACLVIADKSDVRRARVMTKSFREIKLDIHDRVNYAVTANQMLVDNKKRTITLALILDTKFTDIMDYFSIFIERMNYCQKSADFLGYEFKLKINNSVLA